MFVFVLFLISMVKAEGYYCPYTDLGATSANQLLYDYYNGDSFQGYWTRTGETGWQSISEYCRLKGDTSVHADAGEWKCNDSYQLCSWTGTSCVANQSRQPDCKELCQAILNDEGPDCLGNCPGGQSEDNLHMKYCGWSIPKSPGDSFQSTTTSIPTSMSTSIPTSMSTSLPTSMSTSLPTSIPTSIPTSLPTSIPTSLPTERVVPVTVTVTVTVVTSETEMPRFSRKGRSCGNNRKINIV
jgi:hypothetical protein